MRADVRAFIAGLLLPSLLATAAWQRPSKPIFGFTASSTRDQTQTEARLLKLPSAERIRESHRFLAGEPHIAGSARDHALAEWTRDEFAKAGLEQIEIVEHQVLLPWPQEVVVEMTAPKPWRASMREDPIAGDEYTQAESLGLPYHAYSASGEISAPVVYAGSGNPADYEWLAARGIDIRGKIALVRYSVPYSYRGFKALAAQERGAAGLLIYSDPADDGFKKGKVYPEGPWGPESHIQRGGIVYDFMVPGDPLTPGWASLPGARRIDMADAVSLPKIISAPLSYKDARVILEALEGPTAPAGWQGGLPMTYRVGGGAATVRMRVRADDRVRPIWTVTGMIRGSERPDEVVIVGNHRDAWVYGGVDPSSGSAALIELARTLGELARTGSRPKRSILFASWDAEEFTLTSSTEWGEQKESWLRDRAVAYLNVDSAASGPNFSAAAVPALNRLISEAAQAVRDPVRRLPIASVVRNRRLRERGALPTGSSTALVNNRLGSGSDYTVFLNHLGVAVADLSFDGPYGVYHSAYDNHNWVSRIGDPGFRYHVTLVQLWGVIALRLANADALPLDYEPYATTIEAFVAAIQKRWQKPGVRNQPIAGAFADVKSAISEMKAAARTLNRRRTDALSRSDAMALQAVNRGLMSAERALLNPAGIPGRPWYRHLIYAPKYTYAPEVLPGVAEAVDAPVRDDGRISEQLRQLAAALRRAAAALQELR
jgi:N-acetylated-alpha-linked acidic dipeptidase